MYGDPWNWPLSYRQRKTFWQIPQQHSVLDTLEYWLEPFKNVYIVPSLQYPLPKDTLLNDLFRNDHSVPSLYYSLHDLLSPCDSVPVAHWWRSRPSMP